MNPALALLFGAGVAALAWSARSLSRSGALAAALVGAGALVAAGWWGGALLLTFFIGSSAVSRLAPDPAAERGEAKGNARDAGQVLANGGAPVAGALLVLGDPGASLAVLATGLAAAAADTWATALGATSPTPPRHLLTGRIVVAGTSGGVTWRGTLGGALGASTLAVVAYATTLDPSLALGTGPRLAAAVLLLGTTGMLLDSALGATLQGRFRCDRCDAATERRTHRCGTAATHTAGLAWLTNDGVNALSTICITGLGCWWWSCWR
jgi:uncharacterized protein (TIGR00297 family)